MNYEAFYQQLERNLRECASRGQSEVQQVRDCFGCCDRYWVQLSRNIRDDGFENEDAEIHFFKKVKPVFTGQGEYYRLRWLAIKMQNGYDSRQKRAFWSRELHGVKRFFEIQNDFYQYMLSGSSDQDQQFFLRTTNNGMAQGFSKVYGSDHQPGSAKDYLLTSLFAYDLYEKYIEHRVTELAALDRSGYRS